MIMLSEIARALKAVASDRHPSCYLATEILDTGFSRYMPVGWSDIVLEF